MPFDQLVKTFETLKKSRRQGSPKVLLNKVGELAAASSNLLDETADWIPIRWLGSGAKLYSVAALAGTVSPVSRAVNDALMIRDPDEFILAWDEYESQLLSSEGQRHLEYDGPQSLDRVLYTAVMSWAVAVDLFSPSNGRAGSYLEMLVASSVAQLLGQRATSAVKVLVPEDQSVESIPLDITFEGENRSLAIPTKISTRERISQAYVHAAILDAAFPGKYRTILCIGNETNAYYPPGAKKVASNLCLKETLVPRTIHLYEKYISKLDGLYYLDPPQAYVDREHSRTFPPVAPLSELLLSDLLWLSEGIMPEG